MKKIKTTKNGEYNFKTDEIGKVYFIETEYKSLEQKRELKNFDILAERATVIYLYQESPTNGRALQRFNNLFEREFIKAVKTCNNCNLDADILLQFKKVINPETAIHFNPDEKVNLFRELVAFNSEKRIPAKKTEPSLFGLPFQLDGETAFREFLSDLQCQDMILIHENKYCIHAVSKESAYRTLISILYYSDEQELTDRFFMLSNKWKTAADIFLMKIGEGEPEKISRQKLGKAFSDNSIGNEFTCQELDRIRGM